MAIRGDEHVREKFTFRIENKIITAFPKPPTSAKQGLVKK